MSVRVIDTRSDSLTSWKVKAVASNKSKVSEVHNYTIAYLHSFEMFINT